MPLYLLLVAQFQSESGAAWGNKLRGSSCKTVIFFGEGATETGVFHESLGFAALHEIPVFLSVKIICIRLHARKSTSIKQRSLKKLLKDIISNTSMEMEIK